jgi:hypothetical protein
VTFFQRTRRVSGLGLLVSSRELVAVRRIVPGMSGLMPFSTGAEPFQGTSAFQMGRTQSSLAMSNTMKSLSNCQ